VADGIRLDKFLWFARIAKTRPLALALIEAGHVRRNGQPVERASAAIRVGDVLTFAQRGVVRVLRVEALPARRGPPAEARACYCELTEPTAAA
jgi:ribosome-associated heat shock protein Hsp15